jgi:spermidine/putrescine transport system ATP-binding protein
VVRERNRSSPGASVGTLANPRRFLSHSRGLARPGVERAASRGGKHALNATEGSVELRGVTKRFGSVTAVDSIDLDVEPGEFLSLLGPSGCGKTTSLRMLAGFEDPTEGEIRISGTAVQGVPPHKRDVNTVFQHYSLFPHMTVAENVAYGLRQKKVEKSEIGRRVGEALEMVKMSALAGRKPRQMSGGQQQRVALARALVNRPSVLLLYEPLGALDRKLREEMQIELKLIQTQVGTTFIFVTHDQQEALSMSDRIAIMLDGHIEQLADPNEIYDHPNSAFVAGFIGQQNFFEGTAKDSGKTLVGDGWTMVSTRTPVGTVDGQAALAAVRPEAMSVAAQSPNGTTNTLSGTLASAAHLGDVMQFVLITPGRKEILARLPRLRAPKLEVGSEVWCTWEAADTHVFGAQQADIVLADPAMEGAPAE